MANKAQAEALLNNKLLDDLLEGYMYSVFDTWKVCSDPRKRDELYAKGQAIGDIQLWVENKCKGILDE
jgi:hypothetical protein